MQVVGHPFLQLGAGWEGGSGMSQLAATSLSGVALKQSSDSQNLRALSRVPLAGWCCRVGL